MIGQEGYNRGGATGGKGGQLPPIIFTKQKKTKEKEKTNRVKIKKKLGKTITK